MDCDQKEVQFINPEVFFNRDAQVVAKDLLGKVLQRKIDDIWISGNIPYSLQNKTTQYYKTTSNIRREIWQKYRLMPVLQENKGLSEIKYVT